MSLMINEIFYSIQGESTLSGLPCVFIRLTGCNLRCSYCDTSYAYHNGKQMQISEIIDKIFTYKCNLVEITGGEPLLQKETPFLVDRLIEHRFKVMIETNGSYNINVIDDECVKIVDIKCPTSNESSKNDLNNLSRLSPWDQIKFVIGNREDYLYSKNILESNSLPIPGSQVLFSPLHGKIDPSQIAQWLLDDCLDARFHIQLHKYIWPDIERGV